jgi:hypothetical protein
MKKLFFCLSILAITACASPQLSLLKESFERENQFIQINNFFQDLSQEEIIFAKRKALLTCENEKRSVILPDVDIKNTDMVSVEIYNNAIDARKILNKNCMELKGFKRI